MKLSVLIATYNQERYIEQAVRGALMQRTSFDYEILVADDCSTDGTREILRALAAEHPNRLRLVLNERNLGMHGNYRNVWMQCRGQYIAVLEGDDYWTDPTKLAKQVAFLDAHPECVLCFHNVVIFSDDESVIGGEALYCPPDLPEICGSEDLLQEMFINSSSVVLRNGVFKEFPALGTDLALGDWPLYLWLSSFGKLGYIPEVMSAYRKHGEGLWKRTSPEERIRSVTKMYELAMELFEHKYDAIIRVLIRRWAAYVQCDDERQRWMTAAKSAQRQVEELQRKNRALAKEAAQAQ
jgi:glycosyltransferase involved in cell wall biosynthesis